MKLINRRTFLRSLAIVCGTVVVCPGELVKSPTKHLWMRGKGGAYIEGIICYGKHGQHCVCNSCVDYIMADCLPPLPWKYISIPFHYET